MLIVSLLAWVFFGCWTPTRFLIAVPFLVTGVALASGILPQPEMPVLRLSGRPGADGGCQLRDGRLPGLGVILGDEFRYALAPRS